MRLGFGYKHIEKKGPLIIIHAVSVGETLAISALAKKLKEEIKDVVIVVTNVTEAGHDTAKRVISFADAHLFLPFDFSFAVRSFFSKITPDIVILSETDFWWRFLYEAKKRGAVCVLANGKISASSMNRMKWAPFFFKKLLGLIDLFCVQSSLYKNRFIELGVASSKIRITGNIKADSLYRQGEPEIISELKKRLLVNAGYKIVVIGSTHKGEEELLLKEMIPLLQNNSKLQIVLAPRHPDRFLEVASLLERVQIPFARWSKGCGLEDSTARVFLLDVMGVLGSCYQFADVAIVAGSFIKTIGGHNILEPSVFGVPVICGPFMYAQPDLIELAKDSGACLQLDSSQLQEKVDYLLKNSAYAKNIGLKGKQLVDQLRGATNSTYRHIEQFISPYFPNDILS